MPRKEAQPRFGSDGRGGLKCQTALRNSNLSLSGVGPSSADAILFGLGLISSLQSHGALLAVWIIKAQRLSLGVCDDPRVSQECPHVAALPRLELAVTPALPVVIEPIHLPNASAVVLEDDGSSIQLGYRSNLCHLGGVFQARFENPRTAGYLLALGRFVLGRFGFGWLGIPFLRLNLPDGEDPTNRLIFEAFRRLCIVGWRRGKGQCPVLNLVDGGDHLADGFR